MGRARSRSAYWLRVLVENVVGYIDLSYSRDCMSLPNKKIKCPSCGGETVYSAENLHRPFCSERCKWIDLGAWATEKYAIPTAEAPPSPTSGSSQDEATLLGETTANSPGENERED